MKLQITQFTTWTLSASFYCNYSQLWYWHNTLTSVKLQLYTGFPSDQTVILYPPQNLSKTLLGTENRKPSVQTYSVSRLQLLLKLSYVILQVYVSLTPFLFVFKYLFRITFFLSTWTIKWRRGIVTVELRNCNIFVNQCAIKLLCQYLTGYTRMWNKR